MNEKNGRPLTEDISTEVDEHVLHHQEAAVVEVGEYLWVEAIGLTRVHTGMNISVI